MELMKQQLTKKEEHLGKLEFEAKVKAKQAEE